MAGPEQPLAPNEVERRDTLAVHLNQSILGAMEIATVYLGERLGLYQAIAHGGPTNSVDLATKTNTDERYVREWLEQQAVYGLLDVVDPEAEATARRFALSPGHAEVLLGRDSLSYLSPRVWGTIGSLRTLPAVLDAFRSGSGVPYGDYGPDLREGIAWGNRVGFLQLLGSDWLPAVPDVHARLLALDQPRIADIGCGSGWSTIALAQTYPRARVDGIDDDPASIAQARANADEAGLANRVSFHQRDAAHPLDRGEYNLVTAFECLHDMAQPVAALRAMRELAGPSGAVIVADERTDEAFSAPGDEQHRFLYGYSVLHCLPVSRVGSPSAATGTVLRPATMRRYALEAGFHEVEILPIEHEGWHFYRLIQ